MASGRHGAYYNKFKENEANLNVSKREFPSSKGDNESLKNGKNRVAGGRGRDRGRVRQNDFKERELVNTEGLINYEYPNRVRDREPGELISDSGSDEAIDLEINEKIDQGSKIEEATHSHSPIKKRKFSPIVWDRDDKQIGNISKSRSSIENTTLPPPPVPMSYQQSPDFIPAAVNKLQTPEQSPGNTPVDIGTHDSYDCEPYVAVQPEDEVYVPAHNIRSSRWANDANSPANEDELSDALANQEELHREGYENGYHIRSSSSDHNSDKDLAKKDYMEMDEDLGSDADAPSVSQSYTDSESDDGTPQPSCPPQRSVNMLQGCRSVDEFERLNKIDEGTYGVVYRAKDRKTGEVVALKKVKMEREREGFPLTSLREINILLSFHHPSVVDVKEVVVGSNLDSIFMVMEYMEHDLKALMETMKQPFSQSEVKCLMLQLLEGTKYLHDNWVLHRDLKTSNLLLNNRGELKICDFGLARQYGSPLKPYTHLVVTLWYRAPELLLGAKQYSTAIDMWSLGCIMAELLSKQPLFNGKTEFDQIDKIFKTLGTPNEMIWPGFAKLPGVKVNFVKHQLPALGDFLVWLSGLHWYNLLRRKFPATSFTGSPVLSDAGFDLLNKLLTYDPEKRITAEAALNHGWFQEVPLPKSKDFMPTFPAHHAQDRRARRVVKSPDPLEEQRRKELQQAKLGTGGLFG